jgi:hypothetical protein
MRDEDEVDGDGDVMTFIRISFVVHNTTYAWHGMALFVHV